MINQRKLLAVSMAAGLGFCGATAWADEESDVAVGGSASASVDLDFEIVIPEFIYFRVGTGALNGVDTGTVDTIRFEPTGTEMANGATVNATATSGDAGNGTVNVVLIANPGQVTITESNNGTSGLASTTSSDTINYNTILTTGDDTIPAPALSNGGGTTTQVGAAGDFVNLSDEWTYTFNTSGVQVDPGLYTGTATYTAATP